MRAEDDTSSPEVMRLFYQRLYPFKSIYQWLNHEHAPSKMFTHREFAFTLPGDVYLRYNSFTSAEDLKKQVVKLSPSRFEIGAVYTAMVSSHYPLLLITIRVRYPHVCIPTAER